RLSRWAAQSSLDRGFTAEIVTYFLVPYFSPENKSVLTHTLKRWAKFVRPSGAAFSSSSVYRTYRASPRAEAVPQHVDLREWGGPIKDQGEEGSCTGHAFSSAREWIARKYEKASPILSAQCLYVEELIADGSFPNDDGAMPRTGCQVLTAKGCCEASLYPYVAGKFTDPTAEQAQNALKYKTGAYHRLGSLSDYLRCLADATPWPVAVGFTVYESFMSQQVADTGVMPIPKPGEEQQGGHEVLCLG